jgi:hypothetical protein
MGEVSDVKHAFNCINAFCRLNSPCTGDFFERIGAQCGITCSAESINCSVWPRTSFHDALNYMQQRPAAGFALESIFQYSGSGLLALRQVVVDSEIMSGLRRR